MLKSVFSCLTILCFSVPAFSQQLSEDELISKQLSLLQQLIDNKNATGNNPPAPVSNRSVFAGSSALFEPEPPKKPVHEIRVYDLADLLSIAPNNSATGWVGLDHVRLLGASALRFESSNSSVGRGGGGMGGGLFSVPDDRGDTTSAISTESSSGVAQELIDLIETVVDGEWDTGEDSITLVGATLVVKAAPSQHENIENLLDILSKRWNAKVVLEVRLDWLSLTRDETTELAGLQSLEETTAVRCLDQKSYRNFLQNLVVKEDRPQSQHALLKSFNGQTSAWVSGTQERLVSQIEHGEKGAIKTHIVAPQYGIACEVNTVLAHALDVVTLNFRGRMVSKTEADSGKSNTVANAFASQQPTRGQSFGATIRMPVGSSSILAAGTDVTTSSPWQTVIVATVEFVEGRN